MRVFEENDKLMMILDRGEKLVETLTRELKTREIRGATISGLGALTEVELGFYHLPRREYARKTFEHEYELISLTGNVAVKEGDPFVHVHAVLGDEDFSAFGGHLFEAKVAVTAEVSIVPFAFAPERTMVTDIGLALICGLA